ncbi:MAG: hypothetical protein RBR01_06380 [Desulfobacterales bacterium]|nr:hypothetical protein [Desulfobacterales bacterium]MDD3081078.1 hypothetical protein [Desulfobacterales bacterium]MDD3951352.1 hypothetical protein [Desulfobacterales bacterium]MDY0378049.1 hypothetical protein [Desulfobacterales bacterium]
MKEFIVSCVCLIFIIVSPLAAAELEKKPVSKTGQIQTVGTKLETKGLTQAPNRVSTTEKVSINTGHKHDGQGSEDLHPNPLKTDSAESVNAVRPIPGNTPAQQ